MEKENYENAIKEWHFNYEVIDNNEFTDVNISRPSCELCEHEDLRWQFVIFNVNNNNQLKVGSSCIKQFNIALLEKDGRKIYGKDRNSKINKLIDSARINSSNKITFQLLNELCKINRNIEQNNMFIECWTQLKVNGTIEPNLVLFLINNFIENNIDYSRIDIKIDVKRKKCKDQICKMKKSSYVLIRLLLNEKTMKEYDKIFLL
jgi:Ca2+-binding EF-hand superfamily protein